ncbi:MAG: hydroxymethylbilane synthase [Oligoflexales bacterium]
MTIRIATRGSKLALWQANHVAQLLKDKGLNSKLVIVSTQGDRVQDRFLHEMGGKGVFIRELEQSLQRGEADCAIHSLKDLPAVTPDGFELVTYLPRHACTDTLILKQDKLPKTPVNIEHLKSLGPLCIATGSLRRTRLLQEQCPKIKVVPIRGNVDTRIQKLKDSTEWDGLILATASLQRLQLNPHYHQVIDPEWFVPSASQGILAIETLADKAHPVFKQLNDTKTQFAAEVERGMLAALGGDCTLPIGVHYTEQETKAFLYRDGTYYRARIQSRKKVEENIHALMDSLELSSK